ncbi:MAG: alkaline phosphatase family protein [Planctomycetota bacterium]|nr:alkaline phosphatase family protein [Planctomycetota bacterium]
MSSKLLVVNCAALSYRCAERLFADYAKGRHNLSRFAGENALAALRPVFPAVTMPVQASMLTGEPPASHGCLSNTRFDRKALSYNSWEQSAKLLDQRPFWTRSWFASKSVATVCWQFSFHNGADQVITPAPAHTPDGKTFSAIMTVPPSLSQKVEGEFGDFPLSHYWGPGANIESTRWIVSAATRVFGEYSPDVALIYLPHLDYVFQRHSFYDEPVIQELELFADELDRLLGAAYRIGYKPVVLSEYGITGVSEAVAINRVLHNKGFLKVTSNSGREEIDTYSSRAFALVDHQVAGVYVSDRREMDGVLQALGDTGGISELIHGEKLAEYGADHPAAPEILAVSDADKWFRYHFWLDEKSAPAYAAKVDIHNKAGYDPMELFFNESKTGIEVEDATKVKGSHGRLPEKLGDHGVYCAPDGEAESKVAATEIPQRIQKLVL